jgi:hypothetical protein
MRNPEPSPIATAAPLRAPRHRTATLLLTGAVLALLVIGTLLPVAPTARGAPPGAPRGAVFPPLPPQPPVGRLHDGGILNLTVLGTTLSSIADSVTLQHVRGTAISYAIALRPTKINLQYTLLVVTAPTTQFGHPGQFPGGQDAEPPLPDWSWQVTRAGVNDTANWTADNDSGTLTRLAMPWSFANFTVTGREHVVDSVAVYPGQTTGEKATGTGFVGNGILAPSSYTSMPNFTAAAGALQPSIIRYSLTTMGVPEKWDNATGQPLMRWTEFDKLVNFSSNLGASVYLSLPAGNWGDGNYLPSGMPLNLSLAVPFETAVGYFPNLTAYSSYLTVVADHVKSTGENVRYWNLGNEVPRYNATEVSAYVQVFNAGARAIHAVVGSDVMMDRKYLPQFANESQGVGFLSFHFYAVSGICFRSGAYCPPGMGNGTTSDAGLIARGADQLGIMHSWVSPSQARSAWHNATGQWLPVLDSETNLNHQGGPYSATGGTDPRIQTLFGAAWLASLFIDGTHQGLTSILYYTLAGPSSIAATSTSPYGGWGFQMVRVDAAGGVVHYANYWSMLLWALGAPAGTSVLATSSTANGTAESIAFRNGANVSVLVVNLVNTTTTFHIWLNGGAYQPVTLQTLDKRSYKEVFSKAAGQEILRRSGVLTLSRLSNPVDFQLHGYGAALILETPRVVNGSSSPAPALSGGAPGMPAAVAPTGAAAPSPHAISHPIPWDRSRSVPIPRSTPAARRERSG